MLGKLHFHRKKDNHKKGSEKFVVPTDSGAKDNSNDMSPYPFPHESTNRELSQQDEETNAFRLKFWKKSSKQLDCEEHGKEDIERTLRADDRLYTEGYENATKFNEINSTEENSTHDQQIEANVQRKLLSLCKLSKVNSSPSLDGSERIFTHSNSENHEFDDSNSGYLSSNPPSSSQSSFQDGPSLEPLNSLIDKNVSVSYSECEHELTFSPFDFIEDISEWDTASLLSALQSVSTEDCTNAICKIRRLTKSGKQFCNEFIEFGGLSILLPLTQSPDPIIKEHAVTSVLNISLDTSTHEAMFEAGAPPLLISALENANMETRLNAAAAIFSLSREGSRRELFQIHGATKPLLNLLQEASPEGKKDVLRALFHVAACTKNIPAVIKEGTVTVLLSLIGQPKTSIEDNSISILSMLSKKQEAVQQIFEHDGIDKLCLVLDGGSTRAKEDALSILLQCAQQDAKIREEIAFEIYMPHLINLTQKGSSRMIEKASKLRKLINKI